MENAENIPEYTMKIHKAKVGYVAELFIKEKKENSKSSNNIELILIVDRSGSMSSSYPKIFNKIIPLFLEKLHYPENKDVHFITFESSTEYRKIKKETFLNTQEYASGGTEMKGVFLELEKVITKDNLSYRILTLSDGDLYDSDETSNTASEFYNKIKGKFRINSQAIRFFSSSWANPDTLGLASVIQLNSVNQATLLDINANDDESLIADQLSKLFINDGLDTKISLLSDKKNIQSAPWEAKLNEIGLIPGRNIFWIDDISQFSVKINEENPVKIKIIYDEDINTQNYEFILADKIKEFMSKLKILKILNNNKAQEELENMVKHFKEFENGLEVMKEEELVLKDGKMNSRIIYLKQLLRKRKGLISFQMEQIKNEQRLDQLNSQQKADYLRSVDNTKLGKSLAKRALNSGELNTIIFKEINQISKNINELNDIDDSSNPSSFYSTCTTIDSLKEISNISKESFFNELEITDILKLINIVGIACNGKIGEYPDPSVYLVKSIFPGCYISLADIATAEEYSKGNEHLAVPGTKEEINNCIPIFPNKKIYEFLKKNAPTILELMAGLGMRRVLAEIPLTFESLILSGLWKMVGILKVKKTEINIKTFLNICNSAIFSCGNKYDDVIEIIKKQLKKDNDRNGLYINNYGLFQMLPVLYNCAVNKTFSKNELQKIFRAIVRFEIYKIIRAKIRKSEKKEDFIKDSLNAALGIDFQKYGTKLPELFQKKVDPEFCDQFYIKKEVVKEYLKSIGWTELIPLCYILFSSSLEENPLEVIKNLKEYKFENIKEEFGINYDFDKFIIFNVVQSFIYKEKIDRDNENEKIMKIIDSNNESEVDNFLKSQVKHIYAAEYNIENQKQIKKQFEIISKELINNILSSKDISEFNNFMKNGITKGYLTHKISNDSSKGYIELKKKLLDEKNDIPLRYEIIRAILSGKNEKGEDLWNNGNPLRVHRKDYQKFIKKNKPEILDQISNINLEHKYREKINRQGHSNSKKSYWAIGFETLQEFYENSKENDITKYKQIHNNCCGLSDPKKSLKNAKKMERKLKRKEFRKNKKNSKILDEKKSIKKEEQKKNESEINLLNNRGRGRGRKKYISRGRKNMARGRGNIMSGRDGIITNIGNNNNIKNDYIDDDKNDIEVENEFLIFGDTRNRKGKKEDGYTSHNKGFKEQRRIYYVKMKRQIQSEEDKKKNEKIDEEEEEKEVKSKKRVLKETVNEEDENYENNYTPIEEKKKKKKKKQGKKDRVRF